MDVTQSVEDYLRIIWKLTSAGEPVTTGLLAVSRQVSAPSASVMVRRLGEAGLVSRGDAAGVRLTERGEAVALRVVRRHRLLETFLVQVVGLTWDEVDSEAEVLEHVLSPRLEARIDELLGFPTRDPHGDPIPAAGEDHRQTGWADDWSDPLTGAREGCRFVIDRVSDRDPAALRYLAGAGIRPGTVLLVGGLSPFGGPLTVTLCSGTGDGEDSDGPSAARTELPPALVGLLHGHVEVAPELTTARS